MARGREAQEARDKVELVVVEKNDTHSRRTRIVLSGENYRRLKSAAALAGKHVDEFLGDLVMAFLSKDK